MGAESSTLDVPQHVLAYLAEHETLTLATASPAGVPRAATLTYVSDGLLLYVWIRPEATTARHVEQNRLVSFTIDEYASDWRETKGIQGAGEAQVLLNPGEIRRAVELFEQKFALPGGAGEANISFVRITPTALQFIDAAGAQEHGQALGFDYRADLVYSVFHDLPPEQVSGMAARLQTLQAEPGTVIVRQGGPADKFFIVLDGEVEVVREDGGAERKLATLTRGQFFGETAILHDTPRTATVRALTPTTLFALERDEFRSLVAQSLGTTLDFDRVIRERLGEIAAGD